LLLLLISKLMYINKNAYYTHDACRTTLTDNKIICRFLNE